MWGLFLHQGVLFGLLFFVPVFGGGARHRHQRA